MKELKGACIIGQSGGPTSVINASAYGVIDTALKSGAITQVLGWMSWKSSTVSAEFSGSP